MASGFAQLALASGDYVLIGLYRTDDDRTWRWFDGSSNNFTNWAYPTSVGEDYATLLTSDGEWYPQAADGAWNGAVCQKPRC